jgi:Protein of unknown function (DUF998)
VAKVSGSRPDSVTRWLLRGGLVAGPVFVAAFLAEGAARPGYRPSRHPVSALSLGPRGWTQVANFTVAGALYGAAAAGLWRAGGRQAGDGAGAGAGLAGATAAGLAAAGLLTAAVFPTDPVSGYPPGAPDMAGRPSRAGMVHNLAGTGVFLGLPAGALAASAGALRRGRTGWGLYSAGTAVTMLATAAAAGAGLGQSPRLVNVAGLLQRVSVVTGFAWLTAVTAQALRQPGAGRARS